MTEQLTEQRLAEIRQRSADAAAGLWHYANDDVSLLLTALAERDHLLWRMATDNEAFLAGVDEGLRQARRAAEAAALAWDDWATADRLSAGPLRGIQDVFQALDRLPLVPSMPPEQARAEVDRLRAALEKIVELAASHSIPQSSWDIRRIEAEALKVLAGEEK